MLTCKTLPLSLHLNPPLRAPRTIVHVPFRAQSSTTMPLQSDISINASKFHPKAVSEKTTKVNQRLKEIGKQVPEWWEIGPAKYRQMREDGETALPAPVVLPEGRNIEIPSRDPGRLIPCRIFQPSTTTSSSPASSSSSRSHGGGVFLHIHGGGWVLMSERSSDPQLKFYAQRSGCTVVSVGYRLAPEHPFPAGPWDCFDVAEYLAGNAEGEYGGPVRFLGGESAGAHLAILTAFHLLRTFTNTPCPSLLLHFGCFDLSLLPSCFTIGQDSAVLDLPKIEHFRDAFLPNNTTAQRKDPSISPVYENLEAFRGRLPKALFTCGTADPLLDDTLMMGYKWLIAGGEAFVKIYEGAPHGFIAMKGMSDEADRAVEDMMSFIEDCRVVERDGAKAPADAGVLVVN